ncbi:S-adenosyl-L-methionine-dependent methyltransferase [Lenzites betulinus]|nr:S-adenosyl-L-methionine-dependent methyltransferase [Lenzites betulinus]
MPSRLFTQLSRAIGRESAQNELRWMRRALENPIRGIEPASRTIDDMVARRIRGEPLQYILGSQPFGPLNLAVRAPVLIPRPETEDWALRLADTIRAPSSSAPRRPLKVLDLCTGTGCIPLLLCHALPRGWAHATGVDISEHAVRLARENAGLCGIPVATNPHADLEQEGHNTFMPVLADLMQRNFVNRAGLEPPYDVITSNPPYIPRDEYDRLPASVKDFEDVRALLGDSVDAGDLALPQDERDKGLTFYHRIAELLRDHDLLHAEGTLALEVGKGQAQDVADIVERKARMRHVDIWKDPWGVERVVVARP